MGRPRGRPRKPGPRSYSGNWTMTIAIDPPLGGMLALDGAAEKAAQDWRPCWSRIVPLMRQSVQEAIATQGGSLGSYASFARRWPVADSRYARRKLREGVGAIDLLYSGRLRDKLADGDTKLSPMTLRFGFRNVRYAAAVNYGSRRRPFLAWSAPLVESCRKQMQSYAYETVNGTLVARWERS